LVKAVGELSAESAIIDGEIVVLDDAGIPISANCGEP
jgi:hypothetical protein